MYKSQPRHGICLCLHPQSWSASQRALGHPGETETLTGLRDSEIAPSRLHVHVLSTDELHVAKEATIYQSITCRIQAFARVH